jgi:thiol-disulfide isomerase/thioredoxin
LRNLVLGAALVLIALGFEAREKRIAQAIALEAPGWQAPEIVGIEHWFNSAPLTIAGLRGKVVVVNFWTFDCANCQHTLPHVVEWYEKYKEHGLVVIGIHTPEFSHERGRAATEAAVNQYGIRYPVAQDNNSATWRAYGNRYWPAFYFIDASGAVRYEHFGEGGYEEAEAVIRHLLDERSAHRDARKYPPA